MCLLNKEDGNVSTQVLFRPNKFSHCSQTPEPVATRCCGVFHSGAYAPVSLLICMNIDNRLGCYATTHLQSQEHLIKCVRDARKLLEKVTFGL